MVPVTQHGAQTPRTQRAKLIHGYTPLIGPEVWQSTMAKRQMLSASTYVFYPLPHPQIRTFAHPPFTIVRIWSSICAGVGHCL